MKKEKEMLKQKYDVWVSVIKEELADEIFSENQESGMTANNSKPTAGAVENRFNKYYVQDTDENELFIVEFDRSDDEREKLERKMTDFSEKYEEISNKETYDFKETKKIIAEAMDSVFSEWTFANFYKYVPSTEMIAKYFYMLALEIKKVLEAQDLKAIESKYM